MDCASPTNLQEKWDEPMTPRLVLTKEAEGEILPVVIEVLNGIDPWSLLGHGIPDNFFMEADRIAQRISRDNSTDEIAMVMSDVMNKYFGVKNDYKDYLEHARQIYKRLHEK